MPALLALLGPMIGPLITAIVGPFEDIFKAYFDKQISQAQLQEKLQEALIAGFSQIEKSYADSLTATFASFMQAAAQSRIMQYVWAAVASSQLAVILWAQVGIPSVSYFWGVRWPSSGTTMEWAYALVMFCLGGGAIAMRSGSGATSISDQLKGLIKK